MHMPPPSPADTARAIALGHEPSTVSVRGVSWFFVWFFGFAAVVHVLIWIMYREMVKYEDAQSVQRSAITSVDVHPPEPLLQPTRRWHEYSETDDLALLRGRENLEFIRRGWINSETGEFKISDEAVAAVLNPTAAPTTNQSSGGSGGGMPR